MKHFILFYFLLSSILSNSQNNDTIGVTNFNEIKESGFYVVNLVDFEMEIFGKFSENKFIGEWFFYRNKVLVQKNSYSLDGFLISRHHYYQNGFLFEKDTIIYTKSLNTGTFINKKYDKSGEVYQVNYFNLTDECDFNKFDFLKSTEFYRNYKQIMFKKTEAKFYYKNSIIIRESRTTYINGLEFNHIYFFLIKKKKSQILIEIDEDTNIYRHIKFNKIKRLFLKFGMYDELIIDQFRLDKLPAYIQVD